MFPDLGKDGQVFVALAAGAVLQHCVARWMRQRRTDRFEKVGTVSKLFYYPVKSCKAVEIEEGECTPLGLKYNDVMDRSWMVTRPVDNFLSQRQTPKMVFISFSDHGDTIQLEAPGKQPIKVPKQFSFTSSQVRKCKVHGQPVEAVDCGDAVATWLSDFLETEGLRLVTYCEGLQEKDLTFINKRWETSVVQGDKSVYSDWASFMVATESSLTALNAELQKPVTIFSFRPNILVTGSRPFEEDTWEELRIGDKVQMRCLDPCTRCVLTTVDPFKGVRTPDDEPLATLKKIRCFPEYGPSPCFGVDAAVDVCGNIRVGDPVYAIRKASK